MLTDSCILQLGIFAKIFARFEIEDVFAAVASQGIFQVQYNFACAGLPSLPQETPPESLLERIHQAAQTHHVSLIGLSGTFNMIHPDREKRNRGFCGLAYLMASCRRLNVSTVTLCTGTRDPDDMWKAHPENQSVEAWRDLISGMDRILRLADEYDVTLAVEPECGNVIDSARAARRLLDELRSARLKVILDPANLFPEPNPSASGLKAVIEEAFDLVGPDLVMAHAKELGQDGRAGGLELGQGVMDWDFYLDRLHQHPFAGPLVMHGFSEREAAASAAFLRDKLNSLTKN